MRRRRWSENADLRGNREDGVNDCSLAGNAEEALNKRTRRRRLPHLTQQQLIVTPDLDFQPKPSSISFSFFCSEFKVQMTCLVYVCECV